MSTTQYYLCPDMYACLAADHVVLLDLRRDKYLALTADVSSALHPYLDLLSSPQGVRPTDGPPQLSVILAHLASNAILCTARAHGFDWEIARPFIRPSRAILPRPPFREQIGIGHASRYVASVVRAKAALRIHSLYRIVLTERRKVLAARSGHTFDSARATTLCSVYSRLRVIATAPAQCLFDSLALKFFLAGYGVFPDWIFGVRLNPFAAHCWLQHGDVLLNDSLDSICEFTPIMAV